MNTWEPETIRISLREIFYVIFLKIHIAAGIFSIVVILTSFYIFSLKPEYFAAGQILVKPFVDTRQEVFAGNAFRVDSPSETRMNTEKEILTSHELTEDVIKVLDLKPPPPKPPGLLVRIGLSSPPLPPHQALIRYVKKGVKVKLVTNSQLITVSKKGDDPEAITKILNAYMQCYIKRHIQVHKSISGVAFYEKWIQKYEQELEDAEGSLESKIAKWDIIHIREQKVQNLALLRVLHQNLSEVKGELASNNVVIKNITNGIGRDGYLTTIPNVLRNNILLAALTRGSIPLIIEKGKVTSLYRKTSTEWIDADKQLRNFMNEIKNMQEGLREGMIVDFQALEAKKKSIEQDISNTHVELQKLARIENEYQNSVIKVEQARETYKLYLNRLEQERIEEQRDIAGVSNVSILSKATVPSSPDGPSKKILLFVSIVIGGIAGIGSAFATYYLDHTVKRASDLEGLLHQPVLSELGNIKVRR
ncbi:MAG: GNVR domain-containing protein [Candidatus Electrothrix aestuarii]|uniref:GNVR domain-containing protein n=1 Tax=Candidatus Electrothrix aestuarii TaxID=3062594 RepID=A0AAU8M226_9BACT|nr:GNVR domain-containing protein [Candidatus Electrothrix aestuarii]